MGSLADIELHRHLYGFNAKEYSWRETRVPTIETLEELISADSEKRLREFAAQWFPFTSFLPAPVDYQKFDDEIRAVSDTRDLLLLVLELKRMVDEDCCSREAFEELGVRFQKADEFIEDGEQADIHYLISSSLLTEAIRANTFSEEGEKSFKQEILDDLKHEPVGYLAEDGSVYSPFAAVSFAPQEMIVRDHLYLRGQEAQVGALEIGKRYPVMNFIGLVKTGSESASSKRALELIDSIMTTCLQGIMVETRNGLITPWADSNFTSLWICLSETFRESHVIRCQTCGLPVIVTGERGTKRLYCDDTCKRKYKRALKFASLVKDGNMAAQDAAKEAGIAAATAIRILERNRIKVNLAQ